MKILNKNKIRLNFNTFKLENKLFDDDSDDSDDSGSLTSSTVGYIALTTLVKSMVFVGTLEVGEQTVGSSPGAQKAVRNNAAFP